jgi:uncharacterized membrane protein
MEDKVKKSISHYMRTLHRDIGFFIIGLIIIYSISGVVLVYRDTNFLKKDTRVETKLSTDIDPSELGSALRIREFKMTKTEGDIIYFEGGSYNKSTGMAITTIQTLRFPLNKFTMLHKTASKNPIHWVTVIFGILILFMAISSFWMFRKGTKQFRRAIYLAGAGIIFTLLILFL